MIRSGAALGALGVLLAIASAALDAFTRRTGMLVRIGPAAGEPLEIALVIVGGAACVAGLIVFFARSQRSPRRALRGVGTVVGALVFLALIPVGMIAAFALVLSGSTAYTDVGTFSGARLVIEEIAWHHTEVTVYRQDGLILTPIDSFPASPIVPFSRGDYRISDLGGRGYRFAWFEDRDGTRRWGSAVIDLPAG